MRLTCATWYCWAKDRIQEETSHATWSRCASVWKIFVCFFLNTLEGGHASLFFFLCSLIGAHFFYASWAYTFFFSMNPLSFTRSQEEKFLWTLEYLFLVDGWHVLWNSWCRSYHVYVGVCHLDHGSMKRFYQGSQQFGKTQWVTSKHM
jgi:hypothetical protein